MVGSALLWHNDIGPWIDKMAASPSGDFPIGRLQCNEKTPSLQQWNISQSHGINKNGKWLIMYFI